MSINSLYPGFVKIFYNANGHDHIQVLPVDPILNGGVWFLTEMDGDQTVAWDAHVDALVTLEKAYFPVASSFVTSQLWTMATATSDPVFREENALGVIGTNGGGTVPFSEARMTLRTHKGGQLIIQLMESAMPINVRDVPPFSATQYTNLFNYLVGNTGFVFGRDGGRPIAATSNMTKINDKLRRKYMASS